MSKCCDFYPQRIQFKNVLSTISAKQKEENQKIGQDLKTLICAFA